MVQSSYNTHLTLLQAHELPAAAIHQRLIRFAAEWGVPRVQEIVTVIVHFVKLIAVRSVEIVIPIHQHRLIVTALCQATAGSRPAKMQRLQTVVDSCRITNKNSTENFILTVNKTLKKTWRSLNKLQLKIKFISQKPFVQNTFHNSYWVKNQFFSNKSNFEKKMHLRRNCFENKIKNRI